MRLKKDIPKAKGRPISSEMNDARERLLAAAVSLFASNGIAGTTLAQIAEKVGVTPAMIHYYFKTRDHLLNAVIEEKIMLILGILWKKEGLDWENPINLVLTVLDRIIDCAIEYPWLSKLWVKENITESVVIHLRVASLIPQDNILHFIESMQKGQSRGELHPDINPNLIYNVLCGMVMLPISTGRSWSKAVDPVAENVINRESLRKHCRAVLGGGILLGMKNID